MKTTIIFLISLFSIGFSKPVERKHSSTVWYYIGRNGINTCAEPDTVYPCTTELHVVHTKEYYPYAIWYEFYHPSKNNDTLYYNVWYNFNDTTTSLIDTHECNNGIKNTSLANITEFIRDLDIDIVLEHNCTYHTDTTIIDFDMYQTTIVNNKTQSHIYLTGFENWPFQNYPRITVENLQVQMTMQTTPQEKYTLCKFCKDRECLCDDEH